MLISVFQRPFNGASAFLWHCSSNCKLHSDEGRGRLPFLLSRAVCVRSLRYLLFVQDAAKGALFPSFAVIVCALVRLCALARCLRLFLCRLHGFFCFCSTLPVLHAFSRLCGLYCSRVCCSLFCAPSVRRFNASEGQRWRKAGGKVHPPPWCVYSLRSPSASRCSFSATR